MANILRRDPFGDIFDDLLKGYFVRPVAMGGAEPIRNLKIDVTEQDSSYKVTAELPGVKKDDIRVEIEGDQVSISAEARAEKEIKEGERLLHSERYFGRVSRAFRLGQEIDESTSSAKYAEGVLELVLTKRKASASNRQLTIQ